MAWSHPYQEILISFRDRYLSANGKNAKAKVLREAEKAIRNAAEEKHHNPPNDLQKARFPPLFFVQDIVTRMFTESLQLVPQLQEDQKQCKASTKWKCCRRRLGASWHP